MTGTLIAIEGTDGSGKATQANLLVNRLKDDGHDVYYYDFPRYGKSSAYFVEQYLHGTYPAEMTNAYQASLFFAMDRYEAAITMREQLAAGAILVVNRYTASNMAHQGGKIEDAGERQRFYAWASGLEYGYLQIPKPDKVIMLHLPAALALQMAHKRNEDKGELDQDIHEADPEHMERAEAAYLEVAKLSDTVYSVIECLNEHDVKTPDEIADAVWAELSDIIESTK